MNALELFQDCLKHPEKLVDEFYCHDELIISANPEEPNTPIMKSWMDVRKRITAAEVALNDEDDQSFSIHVKRLDSLLTGLQYANFLEFTSFFPVMDVSFSMFQGLAEPERIEFLDDMLRAYIERRHGTYQTHGYSPSTIQVRKDFERHKSQGSSGKRKIRQLFQDNNFSEGPIVSGKRTFCFIDDAVGMRSLKHICGSQRTWYDEWSAMHQGKKADLVFRSESNYYICEAKHVKEGGGGQDKQIAEIVSFIDSGEFARKQPNLHYVSFLDGVYFNKFIDPRNGTKPHNQKERIEFALQSGRSYFVNTHGLNQLLSSI